MPALQGEFVKQTAEVIDYYLLFESWFDNRDDAIASIDVVAEAGINVVDFNFSGEQVKVVLGGGTNGVTYKVTVKITTDAATPIIKESDFTVTITDV